MLLRGRGSTLEKNGRVSCSSRQSPLDAPAFRHNTHTPARPTGSAGEALSATQSGDVFPGTFQPYVASVIAGVVRERRSPVACPKRGLGCTRLILEGGCEALRRHIGSSSCGPPSRRPTRRRDGSREHCRRWAGRIADASNPRGVARARNEHIIYLEQPRKHRHPKAQVALGPILVAAARRKGVMIVCECYLHLLLRSIQNAVARSRTAAALVKLHWFSRDHEGVTNVSSADFDERGRTVHYLSTSATSSYSWRMTIWTLFRLAGSHAARETCSDRGRRIGRSE